MIDFLRKLFSSDFMPHGTCYFWRPEILWLHAISDGTITLAYYVIPFLLVYLVRKRRDIPFHWMFFLFGIFIFGCGTTHLMEVWTIWHGTYRLSGVIKALTAVASVATAVLLVPLLPRALALPSPAQLRHVNLELERQIQERIAMQEALQRARDELEIRVQQRTAELAYANDRLRAEIEERERAEEALRKQASLLELAHDAIIVRGMNDDIIYWNSGAEETYGWQRREALGKEAQALLDSVDPCEIESLKMEVVREGRWEGELIQTRRDGRRIVVASRWALQTDQDGKPVAMLQINTDVTEQKRAVEAVRASEARWRALFDRSAMGIVLYDLSGRIQAVNPAFQKIVGYSEQELRQFSFMDLTHQDDRDDSWKMFIDLVGGQRQSADLEKRYHRKDGGAIWANIHLSVIPGISGAPQFVMNVAEDISERKRAEEETRKFASLIENSTDFIGIASLQGEALFVNSTGQTLLGLAGREQVHETMISQYLAERELARFENDVLPIVFRDGRWEGETCFRHFETGATIPMWQHIFFITEEATGRRLALATICRDITERKRSEERLQDAQVQLAHMARVTTMGELAASIAHEVNQPLAAIVANGNACLRWLDRLEPDLDEARSNAHRIIKEANRAADVIGRIRALIKKGPSQTATLNINDLIEEVLTLTRHQLVKHGVALRTELVSGLPLITGDPVRLQQVILNLVMNGIEAASGTANRPRELLVTSRSEAEDQLVVAVEDSGAGIDPGHTDELFTPFFTTKPAGLGMGLSISRSIVEAHGGRLWAAPKTGLGTTFQFSLPVR